LYGGNAGGATQLPQEGHGEAQLQKEGHGAEEGHDAVQLPKEARAAAATGPDAEWRMTGRGSGDGGRVGNKDEEAKRAGGGTPEEVGGAGRRRWQERCGSPNLALMVCLRGAGEGAWHGKGGGGTGAAVCRGVEASAWRM
jgi:hypothetical protein